MEQVAGLMVMVGFTGTDPKSKELELIRRQIQGGELGGVVIFANNIESPQQLSDLLGALREDQDGLLVAIDQEGGRVQRLRASHGGRDYWPAARVASECDEEEAYEHYRELAAELSSVGVNLNFGPVVDLDLGSPAISGHLRSYGEDPQTVVKYARAFIRAHDEHGIASCLKHFPGHGSSRSDSHYGLTDITEYWSSMELDPFVELIQTRWADAIMMGHLTHRKYDPNSPLSLSSTFIKHTLRGDLQYPGLVFLDDLHMGAIGERYDDLESLVHKGLRSGADILMFSNQAAASPRLRIKQDPLIASKVSEIINRLSTEDEVLASEVLRSKQRVGKLRRRLASGTPPQRIHKDEGEADSDWDYVEKPLSRRKR